MTDQSEQRRAFIELPKSATAPLKAVESAARRLGALSDLPEEHHAVALATALGQSYYGTLTGVYGMKGECPAEVLGLGVGNFLAAVLRQIEDDSDYEIIARMLFSAMLDREDMRASNALMRMLSDDAPAHGSA